MLKPGYLFVPHMPCKHQADIVPLRLLGQSGDDSDLPPQDLTIDLGRISTRPARGFVVSNLRRRVAAFD